MEQKPSREQLKGQTRLPKFAIPKFYDIYLKPDLSLCNFSGTVCINLSITEPTNVILLNAVELTVSEVWFKNAESKYHPCDVSLDDDSEILFLVFHEKLGVGDGLLGIEFSGALNDHLRGFYRCTYVDMGEKKNMAVTQFEAVDARRCFPCWDEPALKATFKITVDVPLELKVLSNMPVIDEKFDGNIKTVHFEESPVMSTYLVALVIGVFDHIEATTADGVKVRVYCPVGTSDKGKFSLDVAVKMLELFTEYFSMPYPLAKLDMVAVPEFSGGAMENYGLITYRENELLHDAKLSTTAKKQHLTIVVAHEVAHQWFGNLVTMEWWTHLWLNEGFATWVSYMAADRIFPEWKLWTQFLQLSTSGLEMDALEQSHPIEVDIHHARSVLEVFDAIGYYKGSAIIRMLQGYLGDDMIQNSLRAYMKRYAWSNVKTEDFWSALSKESGAQVNSLMDSWTKQKGYPVIFVKSQDLILEFEQSQFLLSGSRGDGQWIVPITLCLGSYDRRKNFLMDSTVERVDISELLPSPDDNSESFKGTNDEHFWIKVNVEQSGFYRVKYEDKLAAQLRKAVENNCLSATDKFGILDDTYALCVACELPFSSLLSLMDVYRKELDYIVLSKLIDACYNVVKIARDAIPGSVKEMKEFVIGILLYAAEELGWEPVSGESHLSALSRGEVFMALADLDHKKTHEEAMQRFQMLINDGNTECLSADMRRAAYIAIMRNCSTSNRSGLDSLLKIYREVDTVQEKERVLRYLASCPDPNIGVEVLNFLVSDEVRDQDIIYGLAGISTECCEIAWEWLKENWDLILKRHGDGMLLTHFVRDIVTPFASNEKADEVEAFFMDRVHPSIAMTLKQSIEQVRIKVRWAHSIQQEQSLEDIIKQLASRE
ncbi:aminopeptidase M1-like isoform X2 [Tripterygium wilfordii]|uniref:aminopeptidase M1-like isoform X2 n=1 Tax=Tripterygium wilfordii TaxID=458696 RepID=UPI0018F8082D|nr:aminopeptidase M1-like isoform X2 [Tripterygium wilfordii]